MEAVRGGLISGIQAVVFSAVGGPLRQISKLAQVVGHGVISGIFNEAMGGKFSDGFINGAIGKSISIGLESFIPGVLGALNLGEIGTGDFIDRAVRSAVVGAVTATISTQITGEKWGHAFFMAAMNHLFNAESKKHISERSLGEHVGDPEFKAMAKKSLAYLNKLTLEHPTKNEYAQGIHVRRGKYVVSEAEVGEETSVDIGKTKFFSAPGKLIAIMHSHPTSNGGILGFNQNRNTIFTYFSSSATDTRGGDIGFAVDQNVLMGVAASNGKMQIFIPNTSRSLYNPRVNGPSTNKALWNGFIINL